MQYIRTITEEGEVQFDFPESETASSVKFTDIDTLLNSVMFPTTFTFRFTGEPQSTSAQVVSSKQDAEIFLRNVIAHCSREYFRREFETSTSGVELPEIVAPVRESRGDMRIKTGDLRVGASMQQEFQQEQDFQQQQQQQTTPHDGARDARLDDFSLAEETVGAMTDGDEDGLISRATVVTDARSKLKVKDSVVDGELYRIWDELVGIPNTSTKYTYNIMGFATVEAMQQVLEYPHVFTAGMHPSNLPMGFFLKRKQVAADKEKFVLCYVKGARFDDIPLTSLTVKLKKVERHGSTSELDSFRIADAAYHEEASQLLPRIQIQAQRDVFYRFVEIAYPNCAADLRSCEPLFAGLSKDHYTKIVTLFLQTGPEAVIHVSRLLLQGLPEELQTHFLTYFLDSIDDFAELNEALQKLKQILSKPNERAWWLFLVEEHHKHSNGQMHFVDLINAFEFFIQQITEIGGKRGKPELKLPTGCRVRGVTHMQVALDRMLYLLENSPDPQEQMDCMRGINLSASGATFARRNNHIFLAADFMRLEYTGTAVNRGKLSYAAVYDDFINGALMAIFEPEHLYGTFKTSVFRFLGSQIYRPAISEYISVFGEIEKSDDLTRKQQAMLITLIVSTSTGRRNFHADLMVCASKFREYVFNVSMEQHWTAVLGRLAASLGEFNKSMDGMINADELMAFLRNIHGDEDWDRLYNITMTQGKPFTAIGHRIFQVAMNIEKNLDHFPLTNIQFELLDGSVILSV